MSYQTYKVMHLLGILLLFTSLGGMSVLAAAGKVQDKEHRPTRLLLTIAHGIALVIILVGGMGLMARLGIPHGPGNWPGWVFAKYFFWLLFGGALVAAKRAPGLARVWLIAFPLVGALAAYTAVNKPGTQAPAPAAGAKADTPDTPAAQ